jgi:hypothetical protein
MHSRGIISRVTHVQHPLHFREEFLRECSCFLIAIPVEPIGEDQPLSGGKTHRVDIGNPDQKSGDRLLSAISQTKVLG